MTLFEFLPSYVIYVGSFFAIFYYFLTMNFNYWKNKNVPYEKPIPIFGNFAKVAMRKQHISTRLSEIYKKFPDAPYIGVFMFGRPELIIKSSSLLRQVLVKDFNAFCDRNIFADEEIDPVAFHTLFSTPNPSWKAMRNKLSPIFTSGKMKLMSQLIIDCAKDLNKYFDRNIENNIDSKNVFGRYTMDVISSCAFGINANCLEDKNSFIRKTAVQLLDTESFIRNFSIFSFFFMPSFVRLFKLSFVDRDATKILMDVFEDTLSKRKEQNIKRNDLIDLLNTLRNSQTTNDEYTFDNKKMCSQAISFFSAGNETTSSILTFLTYEVCINKDIQKRIREDIIQAISNHDGQINYESVQDMKYVDMVLNETLRKYPLTTILNRKVIETYTFEDTGLTIEKDTPIIIPVTALHFDEKNFPKPNLFDPERFNNENKKNIKPYSFMPFGEGPRICIGERFAILTIKVAIAHMFRDFEFSLAEANPKPLRIKPASFFLVPDGKINLRVSRIKA